MLIKFIKKNYKYLTIGLLLIIIPFLSGMSPSKPYTVDIDQKTTTPSEVNVQSIELIEQAKIDGKVLRNQRLKREKDMAEKEAEKIEAEELAKKKKKEEESIEKLTKDEVVAKVASGSYGNTSERKAIIQSLGFDYDEIQQAVNDKYEKERQVAEKNKEIIEKPKETTNQPQTKEPASEPTPSQQTKPTYKANHIYINGSGLPTQVTSYNNLQNAVDTISYTWFSYENFQPNDNSGTYFAIHRNVGGEIILGLGVGHVITVTDSNGNPYNYVVSNILREQNTGSSEIFGESAREYIVLQTSEHRIDGDRNGNRIIIANRQ